MVELGVLFGLRAAESAALLVLLGATSLIKSPSSPAPASANGHSEITPVVQAVKSPRRRLIVSLLTLAALTAVLDAVVTIVRLILVGLPPWRGTEFYPVVLFVAFGGIVTVGLLKEARGVSIWQSTLLKLFVLAGLSFDIAIAVFIVLTIEEAKPQDPEAAKRLGIAHWAHFGLVVFRVIVLLVLFPVLFASRTTYELVDQNGSAPQTSEASRLIPTADDAETSAGLAAPKAKYGTFDPAPPVDDVHAPPDNNKRDTNEVPGYSVDAPADSTREAHILPVPAVDTPDNISFVPTESGAVGLGPGPQVVPVEQLAAATAQPEHPIPVKPEHQGPSERPLHEVQPDVSFAAVVAGASKAEGAPTSDDAPKPVEEPKAVESAAPVSFPQSESPPAAAPAPLAFPKGDDPSSAPDSNRPALPETTSSGSTPGITFAPGTDGERIKHAAQRIRKISQGAAAKSQQGLARLARKMSVGPSRHAGSGGEASKTEDAPASEDAPKPTEESKAQEPKAEESPAPVPQSESAPAASPAPLTFPKGEDATSATESGRPALREVASTDSAAPSITFAAGTDGERIKHAAQRIRKLSQGAASKSQQSLARLARRMSQGPSRQGSISSSIGVGSPGSPGFLRRGSSSVRQSMDAGAEGSVAESDKKDKKDKRKSAD